MGTFRAYLNIYWNWFISNCKKIVQWDAAKSGVLLFF